MSTIEKKDPILKLVQKSAQQFGFLNEGPIGQQILLLGDTFYGYRFTAKEFTAVWSAVDQTLNFFDQNGKRLGSTLLNITQHEKFDSQGSLRIHQSDESRKAA